MLDDRHPIDFSFRAYLNRRQGLDEERERAADAFAYSGDVRVRKTLGRLRPVTLAIEATVRIWKQVARADLSGESVKVSDRQFPDLMKLLKEVARDLDTPLPALYVSGRAGSLEPVTLGTADEAHVVVPASLLEALQKDTPALKFVLGSQLGHIACGHVIYLTALYYLDRRAITVLRWMAGPAMAALKAWARRATISADRAGLIACRDLNAARRVLALYAIGAAGLSQRVSLDELRAQVKDAETPVGRFQELTSGRPPVAKRIRAVELYAESKDYLRRKGQQGGRPQALVDEDVGRLLGGKNSAMPEAGLASDAGGQPSVGAGDAAPSAAASDDKERT